MLTKEGYQVEFHAKALPEDVLKEKIADVHAIGIRSKTQLTADILKHAKNLLVIGCFCIGTNQVDIEYAAHRGVCHPSDMNEISYIHVDLHFQFTLQ